MYTITLVPDGSVIQHTQHTQLEVEVVRKNDLSTTSTLSEIITLSVNKPRRMLLYVDYNIPVAKCPKEYIIKTFCDNPNVNFISLFDYENIRIFAWRQSHDTLEYLKEIVDRLMCGEHLSEIIRSPVFSTQNLTFDMSIISCDEDQRPNIITTNCDDMHHQEEIKFLPLAILPSINDTGIKFFPVVCAWGKYHCNAVEIQRVLEQKYGQCHVVASYDFGILKDWHYIGDDSYFGKQWSEVLKLFNTYGLDCNALLHFQADTYDIDIEKLDARMRTAYSKHRWGVYMPNVEWSWIPFDEISMRELGDGLHEVQRTDCTAWAIHELVIRGETLKPEEFKLGWGFDWYYSQVSRSLGMVAIRDRNITITHPKKTNYNTNDADRDFRTLRHTTQPGRFKKLTIGTSCCNRAYDLRRTALDNIKSIETYGKPVEWIISDYGSDNPIEIDEIFDYRLPENLEISVIRTEDTWNYAKAKNVAIDNASGDFYLSLDSDNFLGDGFLEFIDDQIHKNPIQVLHFSWCDSFIKLIERYGFDPGFVGKVALSTGALRSLGGYEEMLTGYGAEDTDLIIRALMFGLESHNLNSHIGRWGRTIPMKWSERSEKIKEAGEISEKKAHMLRESRLSLSKIIGYKTHRVLNDTDRAKIGIF